MTTLIINDSETICGRCRKGADPMDFIHSSTPQGEPGCGAIFTETGTQSPRLSEGIMRLRQDIPHIGLMDWRVDSAQTN